jgi:hypothetical protein
MFVQRRRWEANHSTDARRHSSQRRSRRITQRLEHRLHDAIWYIGGVEPFTPVLRRPRGKPLSKR